MFSWFKEKPYEHLYFTCVERARSPWFYQHAYVPDEIAGRFELVSLHVALLVHEVERRGFAGYGHGITEVMYKDFDRSLREFGVGDLSVGKKVRGMAEAFFGRAKAYGEILEQDDSRKWDDVLRRNLYRESEDVGVEILSHVGQYLNDMVASMRAMPDSAFGREFSWPVAVPQDKSEQRSGTA